MSLSMILPGPLTVNSKMKFLSTAGDKKVKLGSAGLSIVRFSDKVFHSYEIIY